MKVSGVPYEVDEAKLSNHSYNQNAKFDLEQSILALYRISDDLKQYNSLLLEGERELSVDDVSNHLMSFEYIIRLNIDKVWEDFIKTFRIDKYGQENK